MEQQRDEHFWQSVYVLDGQVRGFVNMRMEGQLHHGGPVAEILELIVDGSARGRGIGAVSSGKPAPQPGRGAACAWT